MLVSLLFSLLLCWVSPVSWRSMPSGTRDFKGKGRNREETRVLEETEDQDHALSGNDLAAAAGDSPRPGRGTCSHRGLRTAQPAPADHYGHSPRDRGGRGGREATPRPGAAAAHALARGQFAPPSLRRHAV